jgi:CarD family transcriptional regulator
MRDEGKVVSGMKATAGAAGTDREAAASRRAAPQRAAVKPPARAAQTTVAKKAAAPAKQAQPTHAKNTEGKSTEDRSSQRKSAPGRSAGQPTAEAAKPAEAKARPAGPAPAPQTKPSSLLARPAAIPGSTVPPAPERRPNMPDRPPARQPAKAEIFVEGDHVVYPTHGVGKVERIATEEIAGHKLELIHITFEENRMTLRVPVAKARSAGLRKLATRKLFDEALAVLKGRARIKRTMWSRRAQEYEAKINSGDPLAIAEVVRDLHRNAGQPDQSFSERQIYEAAMDRLAAELAALDRTDKLTAATKLADFLKTV